MLGFYMADISPTKSYKTAGLPITTRRTSCFFPLFSSFPLPAMRSCPFPHADSSSSLHWAPAADYCRINLPRYLLGSASAYLASWLNLWSTGPTGARRGCRKEGGEQDLHSKKLDWLSLSHVPAPQCTGSAPQWEPNLLVFGCTQWFSITCLWT